MNNLSYIKERLNTQFVRLVFLIIAIVISVVFAAKPGLTKSLDNYLGDSLLQSSLSDQVPDNIIIIDIDDNSLQNIAPWPWSRELIAQLVLNLTTRHKPKAIAIDIIMPEGREKKGDQALTDVLQQSLVPICLAVAFDLNPSNQTREVGSLQGGSTLQNSAQEAYGFIASHYDIMQATKCVGHISPIVDEDGLIRKVPNYIKWQKQNWPNMASALWKETHSSTLEPTALLQYIPYRIRPGNWRSVPAQDIFLQDLPEGFLDDAYLLIGSSALGLSDRVSTPIHPWLPGVVVHAEMLNDLLTPKPQTTFSLKQKALVYVLLALMIMSWIFRKPYPWAVLVVSIFLVLIWIGFIWNDVHGQSNESISLPIIAVGLILFLQMPYEWLVVNRYNRRIIRLFEGYLAKSIVHQLIHSRQDVLTPTIRELSILFADIEDFTTMAEKVSTDVLVEITKDVLTLLTQEIHKQEGTLDKYIGDAVMAIWNAPLDQVDHAERAVQSGINMLRSIEAYNFQHPDRPNIHIRIGIHSGPAMVGSLGTDERHTYTAIGSNVNKAHRLHELSKDYKTFILISQNTKRVLSEELYNHPMIKVEKAT